MESWSFVFKRSRFCQNLQENVVSSSLKYFVSFQRLVGCSSDLPLSPSCEIEEFWWAEHQVWKYLTAMKMVLVCLVMRMDGANVGAVMCHGLKASLVCLKLVVIEV